MIEVADARDIQELQRAFLHAVDAITEAADEAEVLAVCRQALRQIVGIEPESISDLISLTIERASEASDAAIETARMLVAYASRTVEKLRSARPERVRAAELAAANEALRQS